MRTTWINTLADRARLIHWRWSLKDTLSAAAGGAIGAVIGLILTVAWIR